MSQMQTPFDRLEAAGFKWRTTGYAQAEIYSPAGHVVATVDDDIVTLRATRALAHAVVSMLIREYGRGECSRDM